MKLASFTINGNETYGLIRGEEAINMLEAEIEPIVMLVLSDINMPGMSGIELLKEIGRASCRERV